MYTLDPSTKAPSRAAEHANILLLRYGSLHQTGSVMASPLNSMTTNATRSLADLLEREGKTFPLRERTIHLPGGNSITRTCADL